VSRTGKAMQDLKALRPEKFTIAELDQELESMTLIRALPSQYDSFVSSLLLLDTLDLFKLHAAFHNEGVQRTTRNAYHKER
ncbi:hypothetical protein R3P38DRAFT_2519054, partial [Favolaschia claudopus]